MLAILNLLLQQHLSLPPHLPPHLDSAATSCSELVHRRKRRKRLPLTISTMARKKDVAPRALLRPAKPVQATAAAARNRRAVKTPVNYNVDNDYDSAASSSDDDIDELLNDVEDTLEERPTNAGRKRKAAEQDGDFGEHEGYPKRKRAKGKAALKQIHKGPFRFFDLPAELRNMGKSYST